MNDLYDELTNGGASLEDAARAVGGDALVTALWERIWEELVYLPSEKALQIIENINGPVTAQEGR